MIQPPPTLFYDNPGPMALWREVMHLYSEMAGSAANRAVFARVMADARRVADPLPCQRCRTPVVNIEENGVFLRCPSCQWEPDEVAQYAASW